MMPNILFITCHDLGRYLGCYGYETVSSPALDDLADQGTLFANNFCTAPQCSPSRAALHTGRHAHTVGMLGLAHSPFGWRLNPDEKHIASHLRDAGYETALWGVQHLTKTRDVATLGYDWYDKVDPVVAAPQLAARVADFLLDPERRKRPFYVEVGFFEPHRPYDWGGAEPDESRGTQIPPYLPDTPEARAEFAAVQGAISQLDGGIALVLKALNQSGLEEDTWVIFASDHGLAMPRAKCTLYDPGIETALIMRWPAGISGGKRYMQLTSHVDVFPTIMEGLGLPAPANLHGRSYWSLLQQELYQPDDCIFGEKTFHTAYEPMRCIRTADWKLIVNFEVDTRVNVPDDIRQGPLYASQVGLFVGERPHVELYDLTSDPGETNNLAGHQDLGDVEQDLKRRLIAWMQETGDPLLHGAVASPYYESVIQDLTSL